MLLFSVEANIKIWYIIYRKFWIYPKICLNDHQNRPIASARAIQLEMSLTSTKKKSAKKLPRLSMGPLEE